MHLPKTHSGFKDVVLVLFKLSETSSNNVRRYSTFLQTVSYSKIKSKLQQNGIRLIEYDQIQNPKPSQNTLDRYVKTPTNSKYLQFPAFIKVSQLSKLDKIFEFFQIFYRLDTHSNQFQICKSIAFNQTDIHLLFGLHPFNIQISNTNKNEGVILQKIRNVIIGNIQMAAYCTDYKLKKLSNIAVLSLVDTHQKHFVLSQINRILMNEINCRSAKYEASFFSYLDIGCTLMFSAIVCVSFCSLCVC